MDLLGDDPPDDPIISLVPYAYGKEQIATVTFTRREPSLFSDCVPGNSIFLCYSEMNASVEVDCEFRGITPLYSAEEPTVE
jgi:hypothetical protein